MNAKPSPMPTMTATADLTRRERRSSSRSRTETSPSNWSKEDPRLGLLLENDTSVIVQPASHDTAGAFCKESGANARRGLALSRGEDLFRGSRQLFA